MFLSHKFHLSERLFPNVVKADKRKIAVRPHAHVPAEHLTALAALKIKKNGDIAFFFPNVLLSLSQRNLPPLWLNQSLEMVPLESLKRMTPLHLLLLAQFNRVKSFLRILMNLQMLD